MNHTEAEMHALLAVGSPEWVRHAEARIAVGFAPPVVAAPTKSMARADKPRGSLADAVRAAQDCVPCQESRAAKAPQDMTAAVVISSHNYAPFLAEAVESALSQTRPPSEIVVVDDASTDDTPAVAASFAVRGVRYLRIDAGSVWEARKAGFLATRSDAVCFLDADDVLPPDYLASGLPLFARGVGIVYSDWELFGGATGRSNFPAFDRSALECDNYLHAGSLVLRRALEISRAFDSSRPLNPWADWSLWRRVCDAGFTGVKQPALYRYRRHTGSMITSADRAALGYYERADLAHQSVTIVSPLSGRDWAWPRYREWLENQTWPRSQCRLLVTDTGPTAGVREWLAGCNYLDTRYVALDVGRPKLADLSRTEYTAEVRLAMARIYSRAFQGLSTPFAFVLEDDVLPPLDTIERLMRAMGRDVAAVTGAYLSRFHPGYVAWKETLATPMKGGDGVEDIGGSGFGCVLLRRGVVAGETFASLPGESADYDVAFFARLKAAGWKARLAWGVKAEHRAAPAGT
jgi:glycosyltransferase involved in cell wall biosynthesis